MLKCRPLSLVRPAPASIPASCTSGKSRISSPLISPFSNQPIPRNYTTQHQPRVPNQDRPFPISLPSLNENPNQSERTQAQKPRHNPNPTQTSNPHSLHFTINSLSSFLLIFSSFPCFSPNTQTKPNQTKTVTYPVLVRFLKTTVSLRSKERREKVSRQSKPINKTKYHFTTVISCRLLLLCRLRLLEAMNVSVCACG